MDDAQLSSHCHRSNYRYRFENSSKASHKGIMRSSVVVLTTLVGVCLLFSIVFCEVHQPHVSTSPDVANPSRHNYDKTTTGLTDHSRNLPRMKRSPILKKYFGGGGNQQIHQYSYNYYQPSYHGGSGSRGHHPYPSNTHHYPSGGGKSESSANAQAMSGTIGVGHDGRGMMASFSSASASASSSGSSGGGGYHHLRR